MNLVNYIDVYEYFHEHRDLINFQDYFQPQVLLTGPNVHIDTSD